MCGHLNFEKNAFYLMSCVYFNFWTENTRNSILELFFNVHINFFIDFFVNFFIYLIHQLYFEDELGVGHLLKKKKIPDFWTISCFWRGSGRISPSRSTYIFSSLLGEGVTKCERKLIISLGMCRYWFFFFT